MRKTSALIWAILFLFVTVPGPAAEPQAANPDAAKPQSAQPKTAKSRPKKWQSAKHQAAKLQAAKADPVIPPPVKVENPASIFESPLPPVEQGPIDKIVFARLSSLGIRPALCSDAVFVRRAYLDVIGTLPTAEEAREFIADPRYEEQAPTVDRPSPGAG